MPTGSWSLHNRPPSLQHLSLTPVSVSAEQKECVQQASIPPRYLREDVIIWLATVPGPTASRHPELGSLSTTMTYSYSTLGPTVVLRPVEVFTQLPAGLPAMQ